MRDEDAIVAASGPFVAEVGDLNFDKLHTRWQATLFLKSGGKNLAPIKLSGQYDEMTQIDVVIR